MKRVFVLLMAALMSAVMVNAKTVRGYVSDQDGKPIAGMKMVVMNADSPSRKSVAATDKDGYFSVQVPDNLDTSDLVYVFARSGARIIQYRETSTGIRVMIEPDSKQEKVLAQNGMAEGGHDLLRGNLGL